MAVTNPVLLQGDSSAGGLTSQERAALRAMMDELDRAPDVYRPSAFWRHVAAEHERMIVASGLDHLKQTVNNSYFQMGSRAYVRAVPRLILSWLRRPSLAPMRVRAHRCSPYDVRTDRILPLLIALYHHHLQATDDERLLDAVHEPRIGCPTVFFAGRCEFTQDLCHSFDERSFLRPHLTAEAPATIAELGAGYGRLAQMFLAVDPNVRYFVIDIPPTLFVSQWYLTRVFPGVPTFRFRSFATYDDVASDIAAARLVFLQPHQAEMLPDDFFDAFITISSLAEMTAAQISTFYRLIDRTCRGVFYTKQWQYAHNPFDNVVTSEHDYPTPGSWRLLARRTALVPGRMFERVYACR
jgi:putative sugar O-methyltransferase